MSRKPTLAQQTFVGEWGHGETDEAECEDTACGWSIGPGKMREVEYAARRHAVETGGHVVIQYRTLSRAVSTR